MADQDDKQERLAGNSSTHDPLPYIVRFRLFIHDDAQPERHEVKTTAYSLMEAMSQALFELTSTLGIEDGKAKIEWVGPDEPEYWRKMLGNLSQHLDIMKRNVKGKS